MLQYFQECRAYHKLELSFEFLLDFFVTVCYCCILSNHRHIEVESLPAFSLLLEFNQLNRSKRLLNFRLYKCTVESINMLLYDFQKNTLIIQYH